MHILATLAAHAFLPIPVELAGACGIAAGCSWPFFAARRSILLVQSAGALAFTLYFALLGATTGAALCAIALAQSLASARIGEPRLLRLVYGMSVLAIIAASWSTWEGLPSLLAAIGTSLATLGRLQGDPQRMRRIFLAGSLAWMGHNLLLRSPLALTSDVLTLAGILFGLWQHRGAATRRPAGLPPLARRLAAAGRPGAATR